MKTSNHIGFITQKILDLKTAILYSHSNSVLKLPNSIVETLYVDAVGCVWLSVSKPTQYLHEFDRSFYVSLNYYKKDSPFFLNTSGIARVVIDPEELNQLHENVLQHYNKEKLLVCVRILKANYYEKHTKKEENIYKKCKQTITSLFYGSNEYYHFDTASERNFA